MALGVFSVTGEALNFGGRRMETIMRVAWLPVALLLIVNMATVFAYLSVIADRMITFADVGTFERAQQLLAQHAERGWTQKRVAMTAIAASNFTLQIVLISSFMAPLIRYAGLGEKPGPGLVRLAFGPDQLRFIFAGLFSLLFLAILIFAPIATTTFFVLQYIFDAMSQTVAHFPDPNSLHTIELITAAESLTAKGGTWVYYLALPIGAAVPFLLALWLLTFLHFHPSNRPSASDGGNPLFRAVATLFLAAAAVAVVYWLLGQGILQAISGAETKPNAAASKPEQSPLPAALLLVISAGILLWYFSLRLYAYPGVAVCRKSLGLGATLSVTRGWNIIRLQIILIFVAVFLIAVQYLINTYALNWILQTIRWLYAATEVSTRLVNSGATAEWVQPLFVWIWNSVKILVNIVWSFFSYGVAAGLYGRLYRESERALDKT